MYWKKELADYVRQKTGCSVKIDHIYVESNRVRYISQLKDNHPLLMAHYEADFFVVISKNDCNKMSKGEVSPQDYADNACWYFGGYSPGGHCLSAYWTSLGENGRVGLNYLDIEAFMRTTKIMLTNEVMEIVKIPLDLSKYPEKKDGRKELFEKAKEILAKEGIEADSIMVITDSQECNIHLRVSNKNQKEFSPDMIEVGLPNFFLNEALYNPEQLSSLIEQLTTFKIKVMDFSRIKFECWDGKTPLKDLIQKF